jgi:diguanylate cyclase (GGDEF)-like protein
MDASLRAKLERCTTLPTLPSAAIKIVQLCQRDQVGAQELVSALSTDPALTAKVLKLVNSAAFRRHHEVRSLSHAVLLLGTNALQAVALSFSLVPARRHRESATQVTFWKRALLSAVAARELARAVAFPLVEEAFLCGLLQDLGMLALSQALGAPYNDLLAKAGADNDALLQVEQGALGTDHAAVGAWLLARWAVPAAICKAAALSHDPGAFLAEEDAETATLVKITATAGLLADVWLREDVSEASTRAKARARRLFDLSDTAFDSLLSVVAGAMPDVAPLFDIDVGDADTLAGIAEQAKETLVMLNVRSSEQIAEADRTVRTLADRTEALAREAEVDALTGAYNRRALDRYLEREFAAAAGAGTPLSVVMGDVDFFKAVNDRHGHDAGDRVLAAVAEVLRTSVRPRDLVARWGGEEFLVVLPGTAAPGARIVGERLRERIAALEVAASSDSTLRVTMSFGHATAPAPQLPTVADLVRAADAALYRAKREGRNRVVAAEAP